MQFVWIPEDVDQWNIAIDQHCLRTNPMLPPVQAHHDIMECFHDVSLLYKRSVSCLLETFIRYTPHRFPCYWLPVTRSSVLVILGLRKCLSPVLEVPLGQPSPLLGNLQHFVDRLLQTLVYSFCFTVLEQEAMELFLLL